MNTEYGLSAQTIQKIIDVLSKFPAIEAAILYGSRAKGNYRVGSDIDITLKGKSINHYTLNKIYRKLDDLLLPYTFDISLLEQIDNPELMEHIDRVGKLFYSRSISGVNIGLLF